MKNLSKNYILQSFLILVFIVLYASCSNDDDNGLIVVEERDRVEQQKTDNDSLLQYFRSHYYNAEELQGNSDITINDITFNSIPDSGVVPTGGKSLIDEFNDLNGKLKAYNFKVFDVDYTYYILTFNEGKGTNPNSTDDVFVRYEGFLQDSTRFETTNFVVPGALDLTNPEFGWRLGWRLVLPKFKTANGFDNDNGEVIYKNSGVGVMFLPSGLGFFSQSRTNVPSYSNLIFSFELLRAEENDHDADGVPSYLEDLSNNSDFTEEDTDDDTFPNIFDVDDDGDGVLTIDENITTVYTYIKNEPEPTLRENEFEISRTESGDVITITTTTLIDSDNNGEFDYLQEDIAVDNSPDD